MTANPHVTFEITNGIGTVSFFHPQSNSLPGALLMELAATISKADQHPDVKVILLKSEGEKAFCAGASFDELIAISNLEDGKKFFNGFAQVINAMRKANKLVIGRVHNKAVGGGVGLASAVDYCFATKASSIKLSELAVGIGPFVVGPAVERKIGVSAMSQLAINATETVEEMDAAIVVLANRLAGSNPEAMSELKRIFWKETDDWDSLLIERAGISGRLVLSDFTRNAINKFKGK
jgi:methylglutaconyl-CoA hydratase